MDPAGSALAAIKFHSLQLICNSTTFLLHNKCHGHALMDHSLQANSQHTFAAVFTQARSARGGLYLRQHLYMELQAQISKKKGNLPAALHAALDILNDDYLNLNPSSRHILEGVEMAVAYWDIKTGLLYVLSNGNCRYACSPSGEVLLACFNASSCCL